MNNVGTSVASPRHPDPAHLLLGSLGRQWRQRRALVGALVTLGIWLPCIALLRAWVGSIGARWFVMVLVSTILWAGCRRWWRARPSDPWTVAIHLDQNLDSLEHSGELLVAKASSLGPVARLQRARALRALDAEPRLSMLLPGLPVAFGLRRLVVGALAAGAISFWLPPVGALSTTVDLRASLASTVGAAVAGDRPTIEAIELEIEAPAYTGLPRRQINSVASGSAVASVIEVPDGSRVSWRLLVGDPGGSELAAELVLGDRVIALTVGADGAWHHAEAVSAGQLFVARLRDGTGAVVARSPYARLALIEDHAPTVTMLEPPLAVEVMPRAASGTGSDSRLDLVIRAEVGDDYAVAGSALVATLALGAGEMVQFREQRFELDVEGRRDDGTLILRRVLDLPALGLAPGGELYFFLEAWDNHPSKPQRTRSATHVARWPGASSGTVSLDSGLPMILPPETFRSQRQIIIDTERLLAERSRLDAASFAARGRAIAMDQHALRLRYGAILGDEFVDGRPAGRGGRGDDADHQKAHHDEAPGSPEEDHPHDHGQAAENGGLAFGDDAAVRTTRLIDLAGELEGGLVHSHDSEESATFFSTETQRTLKSSLANMWEAELRLHLADPEGALPYEYRALRLLKEVQQASRVYVRRVGFGTPPLDPGRRFSGELDDIRTRSPRREADPRPEHPAVRRVLAEIDADDPAPASMAALAASIEAAAGEIADAAAGTPVDLALLEALRTAAESLYAGRPLADDRLAEVVSGLWRHLARPAPVPDRSAEAPSALWQHYRQAADPRVSGESRD